MILWLRIMLSVWVKYGKVVGDKKKCEKGESITLLVEDINTGRTKKRDVELTKEKKVIYF
jgi:hypothetical protein